MNKSNIANGQMFIHFTPTCMDKPKVWVKVDDTETEPSHFVDNDALVRKSIVPHTRIGINERWLITNRYFKEMVDKGEFVPINDLGETDDITEMLGWPPYLVDLDF